MKAFSKCLAVALTAASLISVAGCAGNTVTAKTATTATWNVRTSVNVESDMLPYWKGHAEVAEYALSFEEGSNASYSVSYDTENSTYTTRFYCEEYDWTSTDVPAEYRVKNEEGALTSEPVYVYETTMTASGKYTLASGEEELAFTDELVAVCKYRLAGKNLLPVYSHQTIKNTAPNTMSTTVLEQAFVRTDAVYETWYNQKGTQALVRYTDNTEKDAAPVRSTVDTSSKAGYSLFDNSQLRAAVRAFSMTSGATRVFDVFAPQNNAVQSCTATISAPVGLRTSDSTEKMIIDALSNCTPDDYIIFDGSPSDEGSETVRTYRYNAVSLAINANLKGGASTCWYSTVENADLNTTRSVLLKMSYPLSFGLGKMTYALKKLDVIEIDN